MFGPPPPIEGDHGGDAVVAMDVDATSSIIAAAPEEPDIVLSVVKLSEVLVSDVVHACTIVTNLITSERFNLGAGHWELVFDDAGTNCCAIGVLADGSNNVIDLEDKLRFNVFKRDADNKLFLVDLQSMSRQPVPLDDLRCRHRLASAEIRIGVSSGGLSLDVAVFVRPRNGRLLRFTAASD
jgi:hypothetical protein